MLSDFYKQNPTDTIWWVDDLEMVGQYLFSFDRTRIFNLFEDYPHNPTKKERKIFDKGNPYWKDFFKDRV